MGALLTAFQVRIPFQRRLELTNQDVEGATTENLTVSAAAETDVSTVFIHVTGVAFDPTNQEHLTLGVKGMIAFLYAYRGLNNAGIGKAASDEWMDAVGAFCRTRGALMPIAAQTDSVLSPSTDIPGSLPYFDRRNLDSVPPPPSFSDDDGRLNYFPGS